MTSRRVTSTEALMSPVFSLVSSGKDWSQNASVSATSSRAAVILIRWNRSGARLRQAESERVLGDQLAAQLVTALHQ